jgi:DNA-binding protein H-NS
MPAIDLNTMNLAALTKLQKDVQQTFEGYSERKKQEAVLALEATAQEFRFNRSDLMGVKKKRKSSTTGGPKYRHPQNPDPNWTGRGREPGWFIDALAAGTKPEALAI